VKGEVVIVIIITIIALHLVGYELDEEEGVYGE